MPKENTHVLFAHELLSALDDEGLERHLCRQVYPYLLGSFSLDTFYYSPHTRIAEFYHGKEGNPTNTLLPALLRDTGNPADFAFGCGFLTHCALDIAFHPVVYYFSGNYYDPDEDKRQRARYRHRHIETCLDREVGNVLRIPDLFRPALLKGLAYEGIVAREFGVEPGAARAALRTQLRNNILFTNTWGYALFRLMLRLRIKRDPTYLGLFSAECASAASPLQGTFAYRDLITGEELSASRRTLFAAAREKARHMLGQAWLYYRGIIDQSALLEAIPGESLDTGKLHAPVDDIKFLKEF